MRIVPLGEKAEDLVGNLVKSDRVYVEGRLSLDHWMAGDGTEKHGLSVVATLVQPLGKIEKRRPKQERIIRTTRAPVSGPGEPFYDDDAIPF